MLFLEGDPPSLFHRYGRAIFAYVRLHALFYEECKDIPLEVFQIAWTHDDLGAIPEAEHLKWLRRVATSKIADRYRCISRHPEISLDAVAGLVSGEQGADPESIALQREAYVRLHRVIERLPILHQRMLRLRYGDGLTFAEIGQLLNKTEAVTRQQHARILARLRSLYDPQKGA